LCGNTVDDDLEGFVKVLRNVSDLPVVEFVARSSLKWCAQAANMPGRSGKQIRERWLNHLDANIKRDEWTPDEDTLLIQVLPGRERHPA